MNVTKELVYGFENTDALFANLTKSLGIGVGEGTDLLVKAGYRASDVEHRDYEISVLRPLGLESASDARTCVQCQIIIVKDEEPIPHSWGRHIVGSFGDLCVGCWSDMSDEWRNNLIDSALDGCAMCHSMENLEPHALPRYMPISNDRETIRLKYDDISMLCRECHDLLHVSVDKV